MSDDAQRPAWHLLVLPLIPALGAGLGALINWSNPAPPRVDARARALAARLIAHRVALDARLGADAYRFASDQTPRGAAELAAYTTLAEGSLMDPGELTRRAYASALRAGIARQASLGATTDAMRSAADVRPELRDFASHAALRASAEAFEAGDGAALAALDPAPEGPPVELMHRAYQAALAAGSEAIERAVGRPARAPAGQDARPRREGTKS